MCFLVGVDCAAQDKNFGLALGRSTEGRLAILDVVFRASAVAQVLAGWIWVKRNGGREMARPMQAMDADPRR